MNEEENVKLVVPSSVHELIHSCETICVAGCCGLDAFDLSEESVREWIRQAGHERASIARRDLDALLVRISTINTKFFCDSVNCYWEPWDAHIWFSFFASCLELAGIPSATPVPPAANKPPINRH